MKSLRWLGCGVVLLALVSTVSAQEGANMKVRDAVELWRGDGLVTRYYTSGFPRPIFWPVHAPGGQSLTRDWPMGQKAEGGSTDHIHQKSLWFCHGDVIPDGMQLKYKIRGVEGVDFWSEAPGHGRIVMTKMGPREAGNGHAVVRTHNEWRTADGVKIMDEDRVIHCYDLGKATLLVLRIDLQASVVPITFGDTKEGALGVRINDAIRAGKFGPGKIENALGKFGEKECWGHTADWCDYSGPIDGKVAGLAVLADPANAQPTYWHVRDYGLMGANPFGRKKAGFHDGAAEKPLVRLAQGDHLALRYGILLHSGDAREGEVAENYQRFVKLREKE